MKRRANGQYEDEGSPTASTSASARPAKRSKTIASCASCRKSKTRCEILDLTSLDVDIKCHRCKVLSIPCSYTDMDKNLFKSYLPPAPKRKYGIGKLGEWLQNATASVLDDTPLLGSPVARNPSRPDHLWHYIIAPLDWSSPIVAIQELLTENVPNIPDSLPPPPLDRSLEDILTSDQISQLLTVFSVQYAPWFALPNIRDVNTGLLELVQCCIASRHMDVDTRSLVAERLQQLTEDRISKLLFNSKAYQSLEAIQCLLILSLWAPISGNSESSKRDGRSLIAAAVSMAMNMKLDMASGRLEAASPKGESPRVDGETIELGIRARLWLAVVNTESILCAGTGRGPLGRRSESDMELIANFFSTPTTIAECRDLRLKLMTSLFQTTERVHSLQLSSPSQVDEWQALRRLTVNNPEIPGRYDEAAKILDRLSVNLRVLLPLETLTDYDQPHFRMSVNLHRICRILVLYHAIFDARSVFRSENTHSWMITLQAHGLALIPHWGKEMLCLGENVMLDFINTDPKFLSTSPDAFFTMFAFIVGIVVGVKFIMLRKMGVQLMGCSDKLLSRALDHLCQVSLAPDHPAHRCSRLVSAMIGSWEKRHLALDGKDAPIGPLSATPSTSSESQQTLPTPPPLGMPLELPTVNEPLLHQTMAPQLDPNNAHWMFNSNTMDDTEFWAALLGSNQTGYVSQPGM